MQEIYFEYFFKKRLPQLQIPQIIEKMYILCYNWTRLGPYWFRQDINNYCVMPSEIEHL